ncbi:MAG: hypothetical protein Kow0089_17250 [Desulfobulbaceae bacterium]
MTTCVPRPSKADTSDIPDLPEGVPPLRAFYLYLSNSCNLACRHCWITPRRIMGRPDPGEIIGLDDLAAAVEEGKKLGLASVKLTGGEPMLHPHFGEIVDLMSSHGLNMVMETNATLMTAEMAHHLKNHSTMDFLSVSLDSTDEAAHDAFRGVPGAFAAALQGLDHLVAAGFDTIQVIMSVHRGNVHEVEKMARFAAAHGAASIKYSPVTSSGRGRDMQERGETLGFEDILSLSRFVYTELGERLRADNISIVPVLNVPPALMPLTEIMRREGATGDCGVLGILGILGSGEIALCGIGRNIPELTYGRLGESSIRDIWLHHPTILRLRAELEEVDSYPDICRECAMARHCRTGCVAQNYVNGRRLVWPDALCRQAVESGVFPETRRKKPSSIRNQKSI